ncbi:MAG: MFS transporter [Gammaproteobacteria bacterium]|nr:MFS transporter [Gammaproteobacteria bacterium]
MNLYRETFSHIKSFPTVFWIVISATLINQIGNMAFVFLVVYTTQHLGWTLMQGSLAFALFSVSMLVSGLVAGSLIDYIGAARMMSGAVFANGLTLLIFPLIHQYDMLLAMCLIWGFFYGAYRPASQTLVSHLSRPGLHKITFSVYRLVLNLGMSIGPAIGGYLAVHSFPAIFIVNGISNILAGIILFVGLGSTWMHYRAAEDHKKIISIKWLKYDPALRLFVIAMIPVSMVFFQHESTLPVFLKQDLHLPLSFYGWLFTINTLMIVFFELILNVATLNWSYRVNFILGTFFIALGFFGMAFATTGAHIIFLTILWTIGEMILYPASSSYIADIAPAERRGSYMGIYSTCSNLGMLLGPASGAVVMQYFGGDALWIACGIWGCISIITFNFIKQPS